MKCFEIDQSGITVSGITVLTPLCLALHPRGMKCFGGPFLKCRGIYRFSKNFSSLFAVFEFTIDSLIVLKFKQNYQETE